MTSEIALRWLPVAAAALLAAAALAAAHGRRWWTPAVAVAGVLAIATAGWQQRRIEHDVGKLSLRLADIREAGPPPAHPDPAATIRQAADRLSEYALRVKQLEEKIATLRQAGRDRAIGAAAAAGLADYLRGFGSHPVVVSSVPNDVEAFDYANQLVDVLNRAKWDARGPEITTIFGDEPTMAIGFYVNGAQLPDTAGILAGAFKKFDIPYDSRVAPSDAIPDPGTVELFVGPKPSGPPPGGGFGSSGR